MHDLAVIRRRMRASFLTAPDAGQAALLQTSLADDGSWADVNYAGSATTAWEPAEHLRRLQTLTQAWLAPESALHGHAGLSAAISRALDYWLQRDPRRPWWWDCIGAPGRLSQVLMMREGCLTDFQRRKGLAILERAELTGTGQNLVWQAEITARRAVLQDDAALLKRAFERIAAEIRISDGEGLQADFSFHQHGHCLYNHGYGAGFAQDNARLAALVDGTAFAFPPETIKRLSAYILDGSQWLARGPHADFGAEGREMTRPNQSAQYLGAAAQNMLAVATGREAEFRALAARVAREPGAAPLVGNKHFHRSDIMVHHRPGWYMSARMFSTRTQNTDGLSGCDEGLLSHYIADGATCLMQNGQEYANLCPVWDWQRVPGTTVERSPHRPGDPRRKTSSPFAGGASDGTAGVAAFHLERQSLQARKAWFFFSNVAVCLGAGIRCKTGHEVVTTLNQCRWRGPVIVEHAGRATPLTEGRHALQTQGIWHDGVAYTWEPAAPVTLTIGTATGNWNRISAQRSADPVRDTVFGLALSHGIRPDGAAYAYAVLPGVRAEDLAALTRQPPFTILANAEAVQAVTHPGDEALGVVFHAAGQCEWRGGRLSVDRPCALVLRREQQAWRLAVADPAAGSGTVRVAIAWPDGRAQRLDVALPDGHDAGGSIIVRLEPTSPDPPVSGMRK